MSVPHILAIHYKPSKILQPEEADTWYKSSLCLREWCCSSNSYFLFQIIIYAIPVSVQTPKNLFWGVLRCFFFLKGFIFSVLWIISIFFASRNWVWLLNWLKPWGLLWVLLPFILVFLNHSFSLISPNPSPRFLAQNLLFLVIFPQSPGSSVQLLTPQAALRGFSHSKGKAGWSRLAFPNDGKLSNYQFL